ncbi:MAG TPA: maleylpyruvate isomerase N-terminal domain-containing protein [Candidatus Limnocylindrales bacterium]|nr:maleylpyruvate isomerase N-terminal domain-containing protein [Candidatus Limnocylindrales bacterium]
MTVVATRTLDLRRAPLVKVRGIDYRSAARDFWADEAALRDRLVATWAGLDDAAWRLPGAAPSDAGGPDWSLHDHAAHLVDWYEIAIEYVARVLAGSAWPADGDFDGGDFDRFNERHRDAWASVASAEVRRRGEAAHSELLRLVRRLRLDAIRADDAWGWVYMVLHGHAIDHLGIIEPWAGELRRRQADGDPFRADPRPAGDGSPAAIAAFWEAEASVMSLFDEVVRPVPLERWDDAGATDDWTLKDHVAHVARWFEEGADIVHEHRRTGSWRTGPADGLDAWNAREVEAARPLDAASAVARFDAGHHRILEAVRSMSPADLASPEGGEWTYECLHGHVRSHLAMVGQWCARIGWPASGEATAGS